MKIELSKLPISGKLLFTMLLLCIALTYVSLIGNIYIDTELKVPMINEAYSNFEWIELMYQSHEYLPYYSLFLFALPVFLFVFGTSFSRKLKQIMAVLPFLIILIDIGCMWAIPYVHAGFFAWLLFFAGNALAICFAILFFGDLYEMWVRKLK